MHSLIEKAKDCFLESNPLNKAFLAQELYSDWKNGILYLNDAPNVSYAFQLPGMPDKPQIVAPSKVDKRKPGSIEGRSALIHSLAHIEFTAINLAMDAIIRYPSMPVDYYEEWISCGADEAGHFIQLCQQLEVRGYEYGSFNAHNELWKMAITTEHNLADRMAIIHRVFEARALDVIPATIKQFDQLGEKAMVKLLSNICNDEISHVRSGSRWFRYKCEQDGLNPDEHFEYLMTKYLRPLSGAINVQARQKAGFSEAELDFLTRRKKG